MTKCPHRFRTSSAKPLHHKKIVLRHPDHFLGRFVFQSLNPFLDNAVYPLGVGVSGSYPKGAREIFDAEWSRGRMPEVVYRSEVPVERVKGPVRRANLSRLFSAFVGQSPSITRFPRPVADPRAMTPDYIVAAAVG
jgi:hypothetical protein